MVYPEPRRTASEIRARLDSLVQVVDVEYWQHLDHAGGHMEKGGYLRVNHYNIKPGAGNDWFRLETTYWKPFVEAWNKNGGKVGWGIWVLRMPQGDNLPHDALTTDFFPDWSSLIHDAPLSDVWSQVHPHTSYTWVFDQLRSRHDIEVHKITVDEVRHELTKSKRPQRRCNGNLAMLFTWPKPILFSIRSDLRGAPLLAQSLSLAPMAT
jgi:hypothetical protein